MLYLLTKRRQTNMWFVIDKKSDSFDNYQQLLERLSRLRCDNPGREYKVATKRDLEIRGYPFTDNLENYHD